MGKVHDRLLDHYSIPTNLEFLDTQITQIYQEQAIGDLFGIHCKKTPDIIALSQNDVYIGEIKGRYTHSNLLKALRQVKRYCHILRRNRIQTTPFVIVGDYRQSYPLERILRTRNVRDLVPVYV